MYYISWPSLVVQLVKNWHATWRPGFDPWVWTITWRKNQLPIPVFLPGEFYGQRSWQMIVNGFAKSQPQLNHFHIILVILKSIWLFFLIAFFVFIFHQHFEGITALSLAFNVGDAKSDANMTATFKVIIYFFLIKILFFFVVGFIHWFC